MIKRRFSVYIILFCIGLIFFAACKVDEGTDVTDDGPAVPAGERLTWQFPVEQLREDFVQMRDALETNHPARLRYETEGELNHLFNVAYDSLQNPMTELEFYRVVAPLVARYHCGHTRATLSNHFFDDFVSRGQVLPQGMYWTGGKAYVDADYNSNSGIVPGSEVVSINGVAVDQIYNRIMSGMSADAFNTTFKISILNQMFSTLYYYFWGEIDHFDLVVKAPGDVEESSTSMDAGRSSDVGGEIHRRFPHHTDLDFTISGNTAVLTVPTFVITDPQYESFFNDSFEELNRLGIENLIIDVRGNDGGAPEMSWTLISHLVNEPFNYFKSGMGYNEPHQIHYDGNVYVLINGRCFSTTGHFCSLLRHLDLAVFIGDIGGGTYRCNDNSTTIQLRNTNISLSVARTTYETSVPDHDVSEGFIPDHLVVPTIDDILNRNDPQMEYALQLIDSNQN